MPSYNKVLVMGHMTRDPEMSYTPAQTPVTVFAVATNRKFKTADGQAKEDVCFFDCVSFGRTAEIINKWFRKGAAIFIEGRMKYESWQDKATGAKKSRMKLVAESFQFIGGQKQEARGGSSDSPPPSEDDAQDTSGSDTQPPIDSDELPF